jgi:hypothetical protein
MIREFAGWLSHEEAEELRKSLEVFNQIHEEDWDYSMPNGSRRHPADKGQAF